MASESEDDWWNENCAVLPPEGLRLFLVGILGTFVATTSFIFNVFLFFVLIANRQNRRSHFIYLIFLALIDSFLSASYILLFSVNIYIDYFESSFLAVLWYNYLRAMLAISHVAITGSALLLCVATFERFLTISKIRQQFPIRLRICLIFLVVLCALITKAPMFFEVNVVNNKNCTGVAQFQPEVAKWSEQEPYNTVYKFLFRTIISTFVPFLLSLYFNIRIVSRLKAQHVGARLFRFAATSEHRRNIRDTTRMLAAITTTYLACNLLSVLIASWEVIDKESLMSPEIRPLYTYSTDLISLLTVFSCAARAPTYYLYNRKIRRKINKVLSRLCYCDPPNIMSRDNSRLPTLRCMNAQNGGYIFYAVPQDGKLPRTSVFGTGFDRIALQLAIGTINNQNYARRIMVPNNQNV